VSYRDVGKSYCFGRIIYIDVPLLAKISDEHFIELRFFMIAHVTEKKD